MPKVDKRGRIIIPKDVRKSLHMFEGMRLEVTVNNNKIIVIPYNYTCKECGAKIPDGVFGDYCTECQKKYLIKVY